jgi:2,4-dienoyl-CoA reductase (NADPH2)
VFDGDDLRGLLSGEGGKGLGVVARAAVGVGRRLGITSDPSKLRQASKAYMPVGDRVAIVGGGLVGIELAEFLVARGREVTVLEEGPVMALEMAHPRRWRVLYELREADVRLVNGVSEIEIDETSVRFRSGDDAGSAPADTVLIATGLEANPGGVAALESAGVPVVSIGDAGGVGYIEGAIRDGFHAGLEI